ncbi:MAG: hypothetical protein H6559_12485 [Lewinellaceae bacterium]|nr:hypothetical protein [Lewinellaceae bacterium]
MHHYCYTIVHNAEDTADLTQDTFAKVPPRRSST